MLSYEDFLEKANARIDKLDGPPSRLKLQEPAFFAQWVTGGTDGGNCWSTGGHYAVSAEKEVELDPLMDLLEEMDLSLRHANAILKAVTQGTYEEGGYYGNYAEYGYKYLTVSALHEKLSEFGYVEPNPENAPSP